MEIKILGIGCARCNDLEKLVRDTLAELDIAADVEHIKDLKRFAAMGVLMTPGHLSESTATRLLESFEEKHAGLDSQHRTILLEEGARRMGWRYEHNPRAQDRCVGSNQCLTGCPTGAKQSTLLSYMPRALSSGARCLTEVRAHRLWIEGGRCVGVIGKAINLARIRRTSPATPLPTMKCSTSP